VFSLFDFIMSESKPWYEEIAMPALLRHARTTYGSAMRLALEDAGYEDIPKNGMYVIGGLAYGAEGVPLGQLVKELGVSKQAAGQLVDMLVLRGYLDRTVDADDRRKLTVTLTERGRAVAAIQGDVIRKIDAELAARVGKEKVLIARQVLAELLGMGRAEEEHE
jgi:DNA-binding MarR family transcriptional regulator